MTSLVSRRIYRLACGFHAHSLLSVVFLAATAGAWAKDPVLTAIEVYDGPKGAAYVQLSGVLINGKAEVRTCRECEAAAVDKGAYNKLSKLVLTAGGTLERGKDGILRYTDSAKNTTVVVPLNAKFDKRSSMSASELADQANLKASPITSGDSVVPLAPGVTLVFVAAPDAELAEYLRGRRANDIPGWQAYVARFGSSQHAADARKRLGLLFAAAGQEKLAKYQNTTELASPAYDELKSARKLSEQAHSTAGVFPELVVLDEGITAAQTSIIEHGRQELDLYRAAVKAKSAGYSHLAKAQKYAELAEGVVSTRSGETLMADVVSDTNAIQSIIRQAESSVSAKQFDQAASNVAPYRAFAEEETRIAAVIDAAYAFHIQKGKNAAAVPNWPDAIAEFTKADAIKGTPEDRDLLASAREQWVMVQDKDAVQKALETSKEYETSKDILHAYEVLDELPLAQRKLVTDDIERLKPTYITRSSDFAKELRKAHDPIRGVSDEAAMERAYNYLGRAYKLSQNDSYRDRMDLLGDELSAYLLEQSKHYLAKPAGSGTELGWSYLSEALPYKASNLDAVRDAQTAASAGHAIRSKLSIRVQFRDQTSQRDSAGFAGQLENALIAGLEGSKIPVKVVRAGEVTPVETDYLLEGDVLQHHLTTVPVLEAMDSKYLAGTREIPNDDWNKANRAYERAMIELQGIQNSLQAAQTKGKKHEVEQLLKDAEKAKKDVDEKHAFLDSTAKTIPQDVTRPYSYTKRTVTLTASIQMQFRINDSFSSDRGEVVPINKEDQKKYVQLENVKPEDTEGVKAIGTTVDPVEFLTAAENSALHSLISEVRKRVEALPQKIYQQARQREDGGDLDGAGEGFLRYLQLAAADESSPEQIHARDFLLQQFNMRVTTMAEAK